MSERLDERLRRAARTYRRLGNHAAEGMFLEAADTICELQTDNAKLREQIHWLKKGDILHVLTDQEYIDQCERERLMQVSIDALDKENAKLRELVRHMHTCMEHYEMDGTISCDRCPLNNCVGNCDYERRMRELGVEVDE